MTATRRHISDLESPKTPKEWKGMTDSQRSRWKTFAFLCAISMPVHDSTFPTTPMPEALASSTCFKADNRLLWNFSNKGVAAKPSQPGEYC